MSYAIVTRGLTKYYGLRPVVHALDLRIPTGCVYGFLGRNGAGKSTTIKMLTGMVHPSSGTAELLGEPVQSLSAATRQRICYLAEGHPLYRWMTIDGLERLARPCYPAWDAALFGQIIEHFELPRRVRIRKFSNGQRAQVSLALAVAPDPELLILDDPTLGLDTVVRRDFLES
ncbi:MAG: ABC transporter ATP-binding protein, partial [Planctomycetaceae bacterium]|nr:ABC transporter ATP-binding protein [Planctomycetaceae bacterium]